MSIKRVAVLSVHTSPLASLGGNKTGGMNVYVREMARELGRRGVQVDIFTRRADAYSPEIDSSLGDNVRVVQVACGPETYLEPVSVYPHIQQFSAGVIAFTTKHEMVYDIVYSHYWLSGLVAEKLKEVWGTPFVQMFHTLGHMKNRISSDYNHMQMQMPDVRAINETKIVGWAERVIAATPAEHAQLLWLYRTDRRKIRIIPPGVDACRFTPQDQALAREKLDIPVDHRVLLFVGRIEPLKAVDTILEAVHIIHTNHPESLEKTRIAIIGGTPDNPELQRLKALAEKLNVDHLVDFLGAKDQHLLPIYYAAATAVLMPSDYESFGMVALEAMAVGTPVIASNVGGLAFLVKDDETGYLVPVREPQKLADRINHLLNDTETQRRLGRNAAMLAQEYSWRVIVDKLLTVFEDVINDTRGNKHKSQQVSV